MRTSTVWLLAACLSWASPASGAPRTEAVAVMPLSGVDVSPATLTALDAMLVVAMEKESDYRVVSTADINAQLGQESMKEALGCDDVKCAAEIAGAFGTRYLLWGKVAKVGGSLLLTLGLIDTKTQVAVGRAIGKLEDDLSFYEHAVRKAVLDLLGKAPASAQASRPEVNDDWDSGQGAPVLVQFESVPSPAVVIADGRLICPQTPCSKSLRPGVHEIEMQRERYSPARQEISVAPGMKPVKLTLAASFGWITVRSATPGLTVLLDGQDVGVTPIERREVEARTWEVTVSSPTHLEVKQSAVVKKNQTAELTIDPKPREGRVTVTAVGRGGNEVAAAVLIDGREVGTTPYSDRLMIGRHTVLVRHPEEGTHAEEITLQERATVEISAKLSIAVRRARLASGWGYSCALQAGSPVCWGVGVGGPVSVGMELTDVVAAARFGCGSSKDGQVVCWGLDGRAPPDIPSGRFEKLAAGYDHVCGLTEESMVTCWGAPSGTPPQGMRFEQLAAGDGFTCGIDAGAKIACWGRPSVAPEVLQAPDVMVQRITAGTAHACALGVDGAAYCWGNQDDGRSTPAEGPFAEIDAGGVHTCALRPDGSAACWGYDITGRGFELGGELDELSLGAYHTCAVAKEGSVVCAGLPGEIPADLRLASPAP